MSRLAAAALCCAVLLLGVASPVAAARGLLNSQLAAPVTGRSAVEVVPVKQYNAMTMAAQQIELNITVPELINATSCVFAVDTCSVNPASLLAVNMTEPTPAEQLLFAAAARVYQCAQFATEEDCAARPTLGCVFDPLAEACTYPMSAAGLKALATCPGSMADMDATCMPATEEANCAAIEGCSYIPAEAIGEEATVGMCIDARVLDVAVSSNVTLADVMASPAYVGDCPAAAANITVLLQACDGETDCSLPAEVAALLGSEATALSARDMDAQCALATEPEECAGVGITEISGEVVMGGLLYRGGPAAPIQTVTETPEASPRMPPSVNATVAETTKVQNFRSNSAASSAAGALLTVLSGGVALALMLL